MDFLGYQTRMNFLENQMGVAMARTDPENTRSKKKKSNFLVFLGGFAWISSEIK